MDEFPDKLATVKTLNRFISPVTNRNIKPNQKYPISNIDINGLSVCDHGVIGADELLLMDVLGTYATHGIYNKSSNGIIDFSKRIPKSSDPIIRQTSSNRIPPKMVPHLLHKFNELDDSIIPQFFYSIQKESLILEDGVTYTMKEPVKFRFNDKDLFKKLPFLKKKIKTSKRFFELMIKTSNCQLRMNFPFVLFENGEFKEYQFHNDKCSSSLFRFDVINEKTAKNGNVLSREYIIAFDTLLGFFFMQNVLSCYTSLLPGHFYSMSEYAQLFYRMLILPYYNGVKIPISLKEIKARLVLKSDDSMSRKVVKKWLKELETNGFISNREEISKDGSYCYKYKKNDWEIMKKEN